MMDWLHSQLWHDGHFKWWEIVGWAGNIVFTARVLVQWYATEKQRKVVVPSLFWWLSLAGSLLLLAYALFSQKNLVFIFSFAFNWIIYVRNLMIHHQHKDAHLECPACHAECPPHSNFCFACGKNLHETAKTSS